MSSTSVEAHRRMYRATVLTTVVAIAPVTLAIVAMTSQSWREGLAFSVGLLLCFLVLLEWEPSRHPRSTALALAFSFLVWIFCAVLALNPVAFFGAAMLSSVLIPQLRSRHLIVSFGLGAVVAAIGCLYFVTEPVTWVNVVRFVLIPGALSVFVVAVRLMVQRYWGILQDLERAQEAETELGIMGERMRFASDLHDIQGHTLHVVNLKIALAEEVLTQDPGRALAELREVYAQVEETIRETRNLAYAQRKLNLKAETENARNLLEAAGVSVRITRRRRLGAGPDELLGQVLRETTTNILRHAEATWVAITVSDTEIEILNDGAAAGGLPTLSGLETLRERVESEGGELTVAQSSGEFRTAARFPTQTPDLPGRAAQDQRSTP